MERLSLDFEHARGYEFVDALVDEGISHCVVGMLWIFLEVLQGLLDARVSDKLLDFRILHCFLHTGLIVGPTARSTHRNVTHGSHLGLLESLVLRFQFESSVVGFQSFVICFGQVMYISLSDIKLDECRIQFKPFLSILQRVAKVHHFCVREAPVGVEGW